MNVTAKDASGATITFSADLIGGILIPRNKMQFGADGSATDVILTAGLPVQPQTGKEWLSEGTDITGATLPTGGAGGRGWLSAIWKAITDRLPAALVGGRLDVNVGVSALPTGAATEGTLNLLSAFLQAGSLNVLQGATWLCNAGAYTSGGCSMAKLISAATTNATSVKASAGQVYGIQVFNSNAAQRYLKLYNKASAPTVGTDVPVKVIPIPGNTAEAGCVIAIPNGLAFGTGIAFALTTGVADTDSTGVALNEIVVNLDYK